MPYLKVTDALFFYNDCKSSSCLCGNFVIFIFICLCCTPSVSLIPYLMSIMLHVETCPSLMCCTWWLELELTSKTIDIEGFPLHLQSVFISLICSLCTLLNVIGVHGKKHLDDNVQLPRPAHRLGLLQWSYSPRFQHTFSQLSDCCACGEAVQEGHRRNHLKRTGWLGIRMYGKWEQAKDPKWRHISRCLEKSSSR